MAPIDVEELRAAMAVAVRDVEPSPALWHSMLAELNQQREAKERPGLLDWIMRLRPTQAVPVGIAVLALLALVSGAYLLNLEHRTGGTTAVTIRPIEGSWPRLYHDVPSLRAASDAAVAGRITRIVRVTPPSFKNTASTEYVLTVTTVAWDPHHLVSSAAIIVQQSGGVIGSIRYEVADDPLFRIGDKVVLFLHQFSEGHFFVVGGPSGRFVVRNGLVYPINAEGISFATAPTEAAFLASLR